MKYDFPFFLYFFRTIFQHHSVVWIASKYFNYMTHMCALMINIKIKIKIKNNEKTTIFFVRHGFAVFFFYFHFNLRAFSCVWINRNGNG